MTVRPGGARARRRLRAKNQRFGRIYVSDELADLYGEYLFMPAEFGRAEPENFHVPFSPEISMKLSHPRG